MVKIFISYRRDDSAGWAGRVWDRVSAEFGPESCFMDVEGLQAGDLWDESLVEHVKSSDVALVLIGPNWFVADPVSGLRRIDRPTDWVRREIELALDAGVTVIPLLVQGARSPREHDLPASLTGLARRETYTLDMRSFRYDLDRLLPRIQSLDPWRPFKAPDRPPMADHTWRNGLHLHWPVTPESVLPWMPRGFDLDTFDGKAWLSADCVASASVNLRRTARLWPLLQAAGSIAGRVPGVANFAAHPIINFKLPVSFRGKPGYLALYMTIPALATMLIGRLVTPFPYHHRPITARRTGDSGVVGMLQGNGPTLRARYTASGPLHIPRPGTFEAFMFNRYVAFAGAAASDRHAECEMQYAPWALQSVTIDHLRESVLDWFDLEPAGMPLAHATRRISATNWPVRRVDRTG